MCFIFNGASDIDKLEIDVSYYLKYLNIVLCALQFIFERDQRVGLICVL
jgi:hypothetical protein